MDEHWVSQVIYVLGLVAAVYLLATILDAVPMLGFLAGTVWLIGIVGILGMGAYYYGEDLVQWVRRRWRR